MRRGAWSAHAATGPSSSGSVSVSTSDPSDQCARRSLNRRAGEPQEFVIKFQPTDYADSYDATLVIETEDMKQTYEIIGKLL